MDYKNATVYKNWLYLVGIFPYFSTKTQSFEANVRKAFVLALVYLSLNMGNTYHKLSTKFYGDSVVLKMLSECMAHGVILNWIICNNTFFTPQLTAMFRYLKHANVHLVHLKLIIIIWNILFLLITLSLTGRYLMSIAGEDLIAATIRSLINLHTLFCLHTMNFARLLFCFSMNLKLSQLNHELEGFQNCIGRLKITLETDLRRISGEHNNINNWVDLYNSVFGFETLLVKLYELFHILALLEYLLKDNSLDFKVAIAAWTFYVCGQGILTAHIYQRFSNTGRTTISIAYNLLHSFGNYGGNEKIREKLFVLTQQAANRCPKFSAWGFFTIDHTMIFMFANLAATYVIVMVQLQPSSKQSQ